MTQKACQWRQTNDPYMPDTWEADCGAMWTFTDGGPKDNQMRFCPQCGHPLQQIDNAMNHKSDPYASEAETQALMVPDTRMKAERKLAKMMAERGADEQGAEAYLILRQIAVELLAEQPAQQEPVAWMDGYRNIYSLEEKAAGCAEATIALVPMANQEKTSGSPINELQCVCGAVWLGEEMVHLPDKRPPASKPDFKAFKEWAVAAGYDTAHAHDGMKWVCLNPMTADLWKAWQAANGIKENT